MWSVIPFEININRNYEIGVIVKIFNKNDILVKTKESYILIDDYESEFENFELKEGMQFETDSFSRQMDVIVRRHQSKYPDLPVSKIITDWKQQGIRPLRRQP